mgnify:CR=1 FL=1
MKGSSLKRRFDTRDERVRILLICEGKKTEPNYFDELREEYSHPWIKMRHASSHYTDPLNLVSFAKDVFLNGSIKGSGDKITALAFDEVYILFDRDDHQSYAKALREAEKIAQDPDLRNDFNKRISFKALPSNPCFELWLVLHYREVHNLPHRTALFDELKHLWKSYSKGDAGMFAKTKDLLPDACNRAANLNKNSTPLSDEKGYTGVVTLVKRVLKLHARYAQERSKTAA